MPGCQTGPDALPSASECPVPLHQWEVEAFSGGGGEGSSVGEQGSRIEIANSLLYAFDLVNKT